MATAPQGNVGRPRLGPTDHLTAMFRACSRDPTEAIKTRLTSMLLMFLQHHRDSEANENTKELAEKCCREAAIWYYRILENLVSQEKKRLGLSDVSGLLEIDLLQRCLVACCLEITITSNRLPCDFPLLLQILKLPSYDFRKVIRPVLQVGVGLPGPAFRHLGQVEENILESLAWTRDSPLWEAIRANEGHLPACQQVMSPTQLEDAMSTDSQPDPPRDLSTSTDQQQSRPERSSSLHVFACNLYRLMGKRLRELCSALDISDDLRLKIWTCFEYSLVNCNCLMLDRHLDQLLMCAIYIIAKATKTEIPFKRIMKCYNSLPHTSKNVCKNVLISGGVEEDSPTENNNNGDHGSAILTPDTPSTHYPGPCREERGNLIPFYNQVYVTKMQHFAEQFALTSGRDTPPLSPYPRQWKAPPRRHRLSGNYSIFISTHNAGTVRPLTSGLRYQFNSSSSERLREINNMIRTGRPPNRRCHAASLDKEEEDEDREDGPSAKRLCLDGQSAWQRRLRNVVNDRIPRRSQDQHQGQDQDQDQEQEQAQEQDQPSSR